MKNRITYLSKIKGVLTLFILCILILTGCDKDPVVENTFIPDFTYEFIDDNNVRFTNTSEGEFHISNWNFGNGLTETTTNKNQKYEVYYREAGNYAVTLTLIDVDGERKSISKTVAIAKTDFEVLFTFNIDGSQPNYVNLENTSIGTFDSFKWLYRNRTIENETNATAYFPYAGKYEITLEILKDGVAYTSVQTVNISQDDPNYISSFTLTWSDEFDGTTVNSDNWSFETGASGWGNNELQNYTDGDNVEVKDGKLIITAKKVNENKVAGSYTSTRMISMDKQEFTYGRFEIRAKLPRGTGIWPAIWMLGADFSTVGWPACGEIDIMEYVGHEPNTIHSTVHTTAGYGSEGNGSSKTLDTAEETYHVYGLLWTEKEMIFYTDSPENVTYTYGPGTKNNENWPFDKPQFFILNIAVGGNWGGAQGIDNTIFPQTMEIDYVRVYQPNK
jgi:beta-glucanase (GH16 family)